MSNVRWHLKWKFVKKKNETDEAFLKRTNNILSPDWYHVDSEGWHWYIPKEDRLPEMSFSTKEEAEKYIKDNLVDSGYLYKPQKVYNV